MTVDWRPLYDEARRKMALRHLDDAIASAERIEQMVDALALALLGAR